MNLSIHQVLRERSHDINWPYPSSILMVNKNVPEFETFFNQLDYDWMLRVTKDRKCKEVDPCVFRYVDGKNLSLDETYRKNDFYMGLALCEDDIKVVKKWYSSRARYFYKTNQPKKARFFFLRGEITLKTILYYLTSYSAVARYIICNKFNVWG